MVIVICEAVRDRHCYGETWAKPNRHCYGETWARPP